MTQRFGDAAARLCGIASFSLGWRPNEFWEATPAELALAIQPADAAGDVPDHDTITALRARFPDDPRV